MYICKKCGKEFNTRNSHNGHIRIHSEKIHVTRKPYKLNLTKEHRCKFCNKIFETGQKLGGHTGFCKSNPNYEKYVKETSDRSKLRKQSQETKDKISASRIKYLLENPDKVPYKINHSSKPSYPEQIFMNALKSFNIEGWKYNYQNGIYSYDFAFPELKIDVEIDGSTHLSEKVKRIDERRDCFSIENGWKVIRFTAKQVKNNLVECIEILKTMIIER